MPHQHTNLRDDGSRRGAAYAPPQHKDEKRGENAVEADGAKGGIHGIHRPIGGAQERVESKIEMRHDITGQNDGHKVAGIGQRGVAGAKEAQDGRNKHEEHSP